MLLIGGSRDVHPKAKSAGLKLSLLTPMPKLRTQKNLNIYERIVGLPETASVDEWVGAACLIHRTDAVDAIGGFSEPTQDHAAAIAAALGLPFHPPEVIRHTRQKDQMRQVLREAGLDETPSRLVASADEIAAFGEAHGYPLVLKPVDGRGSLGVSIVRSSHDIGAALAWFSNWSPEHGMLAEKFLDGEEYSAEAFSERGRHQVICVTQKFKDQTTSVETGHCIPAPLGEERRAAIERFVVDALTALGIENGPSHTEVIVTADGPRIVETHTRLAGDSIVELIQLVSGVDLDVLWIRQAAGECVLDRVPAHLQGSAAISYVTPRATGALERVDGIAEALALPGVVRVEVLQELGAQMQGAHDSFSRGGYAIAVGDTGQEAAARAQAAAARLRFLIACAG
jgi:biotin carboxylase